MGLLSIASNHYAWPGWVFVVCLVLACAAFLFVIVRLAIRMMGRGVPVSEDRTVGYHGIGGSADFVDSEIYADDAVVNEGGRLRFVRSKIRGRKHGEKAGDI
jgi:hypothetical protein